ncbi:MAG: V-type ATP synthase subunit D [Phycisphaerae bacterium]|nr:V-type ATP synthase subunit D [Phycisphaerae bacterium]
MAKKIKLTRPELKCQREALERFEHYLPMLKLKQQQLQLTVRKVQQKRRAVQAAMRAAEEKFRLYSAVLADRAGVNVRQLGKPSEVQATTTNIAGVTVPVFEDVKFPEAIYSLFATPPWVDRALVDLRDISRHGAEEDILRRQCQMLQRELTKIIQRVNLFEKVKIPEAREAIRVIRIKLGDEMTAGVGRAKIAKAKLAQSERPTMRTAAAPSDQEAHDT